jgi:pyridinium-3,5-bisthiocarboxylic acid mononucleotide nickel chelatase
VRQTLATRRKLRREFRTVETPYGPIRIKLGSLDGAVLHATPEFEECRRLALQASVPILEVFSAAAAAAQTLRELRKSDSAAQRTQIACLQQLR